MAELAVRQRRPSTRARLLSQQRGAVAALPACSPRLPPRSSGTAGSRVGTLCPRDGHGSSEESWRCCRRAVRGAPRDAVRVTPPPSQRPGEVDTARRGDGRGCRRQRAASGGPCSSRRRLPCRRGARAGSAGRSGGSRGQEAGAPQRRFGRGYRGALPRRQSGASGSARPRRVPAGGGQGHPAEEQHHQGKVCRAAPAGSLLGSRRRVPQAEAALRAPLPVGGGRVGRRVVGALWSWAARPPAQVERPLPRAALLPCLRRARTAGPPPPSPRTRCEPGPSGSPAALLGAAPAAQGSGSPPRSCVIHGTASRRVVKFLCRNSYLFLFNIYEPPGRQNT